MTITNGYTTRANVKTELAIPAGDTASDEAIDRAVNAASRMIDAHTGQRFWQDADDTTRYFTAHHWYHLHLFKGSVDVDAATVTAITSVDVDTTGNGSYDQAWTEDTHYYTAPRGAGASGRPYDSLKVLAGRTGRVWPRGIPDAIKIVGTFGWATVPVAVEAACILQAARLYKRARESPLGVLDVGLDSVPVRVGSRLDPDVAMMLQQYTPLVGG